MINVDSTIHEAIVSASVAAKILGVKRETLYAYASRGLLRRARTAGPGGSGYFRSDVERLKARSAARSGHGPVAAGALRWGEPVLESAITSIDQRGPAYRGYAAVDLARSGRTFEQVAELLWTGELPSTTRSWIPVPLSPAVRALEGALRSARPVARLALLVPWLAIEPKRRGASRGELPRARALIARMAALLDETAPRSIAGAVAAALGAKRPDVAAVNMTLVVIADHELNVSSFVARVAASAGADLHACISAALAALSGTLHGGECDRAEAILATAATPAHAARAVRERVRRAESVPGFGHPLYPAGDPRTAPLLEAARAIAPRAVAPVDAMIDAVGDSLGLPPSVDLGIVAVARALGLAPGGSAGLFALGRTAGWVAQALEQREAGFLLRPRARYVGPAVRELAPAGSGPSVPG